VVGGSLGMVFPMIVMLLILFIRPTGMFGWKTVERV
jgi:branched-chain amino acid transport system permease protein